MSLDSQNKMSRTQTFKRQIKKNKDKAVDMFRGQFKWLHVIRDCKNLPAANQWTIKSIYKAASDLYLKISSNGKEIFETLTLFKYTRIQQVK